MAVMAIPRPLREKLGDDGVDALIELFNKSEEKIRADVISLSFEKYERRLSEETSKINQRITEETATLDKRITETTAILDKRITEETGKLRVEMAGLRAELKEDIAGVRTEIKGSYASLIKWMFIFWLGQIGAILGILFAFFKH